MNEAHISACKYQIPSAKLSEKKRATECKWIVYIGFAIFNDPTQIRKSFFSSRWFSPAQYLLNPLERARFGRRSSGGRQQQENELMTF